MVCRFSLVVSLQVVSFGPLGILGRSGWFCREADVERWNALAGWRGLHDPTVRQHFNGLFLAFDKSWGDEELRMANLGLAYDVSYLGTGTALDVIRAKLDAGVPALFYLWSPHPLNTRYSLNRIQLPVYAPARFEKGLSDYPTDVLEKVASKQLTDVASVVAELYSRFQIGNSAQEGMLARIDSDGLSVVHAACTWMRREENVALWEAWLPAETCEPGNYFSNATSCAPCPAGSSSIGGAATACVQCSAGARLLSTQLGRSHAKLARPPTGVGMPSLFLVLEGATGYFASESAQFSCIHCDDLGDFYQELTGQTSCEPAHKTRRDISQSYRPRIVAPANARAVRRIVKPIKFDTHAPANLIYWVCRQVTSIPRAMPGRCVVQSIFFLFPHCQL